ncbi:MAG: hypothetical protein J5960_07905 [Desulfovibrio sp.]|nr:hypothetical protein [Desulfovibrio sp.]
MKKCLTALCLAGCLALAAPAFAAVQTFGPDFSKFTIDVPDGWKATPNDGGCQLISPDQNSSFSVQVAKNGGKSASELTKLIGQNLGGKILSTKDVNPNQTFLEAEVDGVKINLMVMVEGDKFCAVTMAGPDEETMVKIMNTVQDAK